MLKFAKNIFIFLIFTGIFYIVFLILWGSYVPITTNLNYKIGGSGHIITKLRELQETKDIDILFIGSSHTLRGFDTRIFYKAGYKTFNLGSNSQTPIQTEFILNRYLDSLNPKIVVFEVCPFVFSLDGVELSLEIISNDNIDFESLKLAFKQNHLKIYNTLIYALYREMFYNDINNYSENRKRFNDTYIDGGFLERKLMFYKHESFDKQTWKYNKDQFEAFQNIVNSLNNKGIKLILLQAPVTSDLYNTYTNNSEFDSVMRKCGNYYNFNELIQLEDTVHFFDFHHLNKKGVNIFNERMLNIVDLEKMK